MREDALHIISAIILLMSLFCPWQWVCSGSEFRQNSENTEGELHKPVHHCLILQELATGSGVSCHPHTELIFCKEQWQGLHPSLTGAQPVLEGAAPAKSEVTQENLVPNPELLQLFSPNWPLRDAAIQEHSSWSDSMLTPSPGLVLADWGLYNMQNRFVIWENCASRWVTGAIYQFILAQEMQGPRHQLGLSNGWAGQFSIIHPAGTIVIQLLQMTANMSMPFSFFEEHKQWSHTNFNGTCGNTGNNPF